MPAAAERLQNTLPGLEHKIHRAMFDKIDEEENRLVPGNLAILHVVGHTLDLIEQELSDLLELFVRENLGSDEWSAIENAVVGFIEAQYNFLKQHCTRVYKTFLMESHSAEFLDRKTAVTARVASLVSIGKSGVVGAEGEASQPSRSIMLDEGALISMRDFLSAAFTIKEFTYRLEQYGFYYVRHGDKTESFMESIREVQRLEGGCLTVLRLTLEGCDPRLWPAEFIPTSYLPRLQAVNASLAPFGIEVQPSGSIRIRGQAPTRIDTSESLRDVFDAHEFHPAVAQHGRARFCDGDWSGAVFECCKAYESEVGKRASVAKGFGESLMGQAFGDARRLEIRSGSRSQDEEQRGLKYLSMGLMAGVRDPLAHTPSTDHPLDRSQALEILGLISFLFRKLEQTVATDMT